jgi:hypothetical protein
MKEGERFAVWIAGVTLRSGGREVDANGLRRCGRCVSEEFETSGGAWDVRSDSGRDLRRRLILEKVLRSGPPLRSMPATEPARIVPTTITALCARTALHTERSKQRSFRLTRVAILVPQSEKRARRKINLDAVKRSRS